MTEPLRLGILGLGNWGHRLASALGEVGGAELVACHARSEERRAAFVEAHGCVPYSTLEAFLAEPLDGILLATPHSTHAELVVAACEAGHNLMVEKPLALSVADARTCVEAAERAGVVFQVAHYRRRLAATRLLKEAVEAGTLGRIHHVEGWFTRVWGRQTGRMWREDRAESPLGGMTALGVHMVDNFHYLVGRVSRLTCFSKRLAGVSDLDDITEAMFEFESGPLGHLGTSLRVPYRASTAAYGTEGAGFSEADGTRFLLQGRDDETPVEHPVAPVNGVVANLSAFVESVRTGTPPETGGREAFEVVAVMEAMQRSAESGGAIVEMSDIR